MHLKLNCKSNQHPTYISNKVDDFIITTTSGDPQGLLPCTYRMRSLPGKQVKGYHYSIPQSHTPLKIHHSSLGINYTLLVRVLASRAMTLLCFSWNLLSSLRLVEVTFSGLKHIYHHRNGVVCRRIDRHLSIPSGEATSVCLTYL